tara:strand:+ start:47 stop:475 length:429 start_codon:yes stop_codon:yes gene_type:complete
MTGAIAQTSMTKSTIKRVSGKAVEAEGFLFRPVKCKRAGSNTECTISIINNGNADRELELSTNQSPPSYLYDNLGNQYPVTIRIGQDTKNSGWFAQIYPPQIPINVSFMTEELHSGATNITATISIYKFKRLVVVRDIPITK